MIVGRTFYLENFKFLTKHFSFSLVKEKTHVLLLNLYLVVPIPVLASTDSIYATDKFPFVTVTGCVALSQPKLETNHPLTTTEIPTRPDSLCY